MQFNKNILFVVIAIVVVIVTIVLVLMSLGYMPVIPAFSFGNSMSDDEVAQKAVAYINQYKLAGNIEVSLISVSQEEGLVKMELKIGEDKINSYATKNGKLLFPRAVSMDVAQ